MKPTVILNIAHSNDTIGKCSPDGKFREWVFSKEICHRVADELKRHDIPVAIVPQHTYYGAAKGLRQVVDDINDIVAVKGVKNCFVVSIHVNAASNGTWMNATGWSAYTSKGRTKSDVIAEYLYDAAERILKPKGKKIRTDKSDGDRDWEENFYILVKTKCSAVLTENFFQDNRQDVAYLSSEEGKSDIVKIHVDGILAYIEAGQWKF